MSDIAIRCEGLSKQYRIGERESYKALRDTLTNAISVPFRRLRSILGVPQLSSVNEGINFWALKNISLDIKRGNVVGVIGRNGAGKSTLLKILSRITAPTIGEVEIRGRVGSLLEVGTGFHPELTGRENVFLNGAILGMKREEIVRKFDEIVSFAEVSKFIDTPVKRYSSGMYVRLAFAVAAHLETEILMVDEVLAVGDTAFQTKCLGKMGEVSKGGRTILFVSHNIASIQKLCDAGIYLKNGEVDCIGDVDKVCNKYLKELIHKSEMKDGPISIRVNIYTRNGESLIEWKFQEEIIVSVDVETKVNIETPAVDLAFYTIDGTKIFAVESDRLLNGNWKECKKKLTAEFRLTNIGLAVSELYMDVGIRAGTREAYLGLFEQVDIIQIAPILTISYIRTDTIICLPAEVQLTHIN